MPKVSVCSSTYNHEKYVTEAIQSVLNQSFQDFELIVTDDASTDGNVSKIKAISDPRIKLMIHSSNRGNMVASRTCFDHSSGEYLAFLTTDDIWEPDMLKTLTSYLDDHPEVLGVFAQPTFINEEGATLDHPHTKTGGGVGLSRYQQLENIFWLINYFCCPTAMIRRSAFEKHGYFAPYLRQTHDMAYWTRLLFEGELAILPDRVLRFRVRSNSGNAGSSTPENWRRVDFEVFQNLRLYAEKIHDIDLLTKIFPEAKNHPWPLENRLIKFHLAHVALSRERAIHRLFALELLYELLSDAEMAEYIRRVCNFDFPDMFRLQGEIPIFAHYREYDEESLQQQNAAMKEELDSIKKQRELLARDVVVLRAPV